MRFGVLGTGMVGSAIGSALAARGHEVRMGSRDAANPKATGWAASAGPTASAGTFAGAASFGEVLFNCTSGVASLEALEAAGRANLAGKVLVDVSNPLDFSKGMPPSLAVVNTDSLGERIQRAFPELKVVKSLNTLNAHLMVDASKVPGTDVFVAGDDGEAKAVVVGILRDDFGWEAPIDLGDITASRGLEMWLPLWIRLWGAIGTPNFNLKIVRA